MSQSRELFLNEAYEMLTLFNNTLVEIEKSPDNTELLNELFRAAHTIKGMAGFEGLVQIQELAHSTEDLLNDIREGKINITDEIMDVIFSSVDKLQVLVDLVKNGEDLVDVSELIAGINDVRKLTGINSEDLTAAEKSKDKKSSDEKGVEKNNSESKPSQEKRTHLRLEDDDRKAISQGVKKGFIAYEVIITLTKDCVMREARSAIVINELKAAGDVINIEKILKGVGSGKYGRHFGFFYMTKSVPGTLKEKIEKITDVDHVQFIVLPVDDILMPDFKGLSKAKEKVPFNKKEGSEHKDISTIRVNVEKLDRLMNVVGELVINNVRLSKVVKNAEDSEIIETSANINRLSAELQEMATSIRLVPLSTVFDRFQRLVRDAAKEENKKINFKIEGSDIELDRSILEGISDPLIHLLRNAVGHGIESAPLRKKQGKSAEGNLTLSAQREKNKVLIKVKDDGKGIDPEQIRQTILKKKVMPKDELEKLSDEQVKWLITHPGLSTQEKVDKIGGRGVGMDVAKTITESFGGQLKIESALHEGSTFSLELPLSLSIIKALIIKVGGERFAIPIIHILETVRLKNDSIKKMNKRDIFNLRGEVVPIIHLGEVLGIESSTVSPKDKSQIVCVIETRLNKVALAVEGLLGQQDVVVKTLPSYGAQAKGVSGVTILSDGMPCLILDVANLV